MAQAVINTEDANDNFRNLVVGEYLTVDSAPQSDRETDGDSALGVDGMSTSTTSLASSVTNFRTLYGRRYHVRLLPFQSCYWLACQASQAFE
jgi:hypothetical protein